MPEQYFQSGHGRVFMQSGGSGPGNSVEYLGCARLTGFSESLGDITPIYCPDPTAYDKFEAVDEVQGEGGLPTTSLVGRFGFVNPVFNEECPFGVQVHYGKCQDPTDFNGGWDVILAFERARFTNRSSDDLSAMEEGDRAAILFTGDITARRMNQIDQLILGAAAATQVTREVVGVAICDWLQCGECGTVSQGCDTIYAISNSSGVGSPGLPAELHVSTDGGATWEDYDITTLATGEDPNDVACVGNWVVVVSQDSGSMHIAPNTDLTGWTEVTTGFVDNPMAIYALSATQVWIVGDGGYVYFTDDVSTGVAVQDAGVAAAATQLNDVMASDSRHIAAVGNSNTVIYSNNGGDTWAAQTGPVAAVNLNCIWMRSQYAWMVGAANGNLYYTIDEAGAWTAKAFPGSGAGSVRDIVFSVTEDSAWGYMAHNTAASAGRILRTLNGGFSWYVLPESAAGSIPDNDYIGALAACRDPNFIVGGGLADDATDGIIVIGS